jgi:hypothetical protein
MNDIRIAQARNIRRVQLDYLGSAIGLCALIFLSCVCLLVLI